MEFRILGPVEVVAGGRPLALGGQKQRTLLAALLMHANEVVSAERLIDALWDERPPETAQAALQVHVAQLRKLLGRDRIVTRAPGYLLRVEADELDLERFERLVVEARGNGAEGLREALALWRGPPLAEFERQPFALAEIRRIEELRLTAEERRIEDDLALGRHEDVLPELEALVGAHPYRERLCGQLMLALYRSGRQAEALDAYRSTRATLVEELGIDPGPELRRLERAILDQDPELDVAAVEPAAAPARPPPSARSGSGRPFRRRRLAIGALAAVLAAAVAVLTLGRGSDGDRIALARVQDNAVGVVDVQSRQIVDEAPEIASPQRVAAGEGSIWVTSSSGGGSVVRLDPESRDVIDRIDVGTAPVGIAVGAGAVWVANSLDGTVSRIDPETGREVGDPIKVGNTPTGVAFGDGAVWVTNTVDRTITRIDPSTGDVRTTDAEAAARWIAVGGGAVWVTDPVGNTLVQIDARTGTPTRVIPVGSGPTAVAYDAGSVFVTNSLDGTLSRVDARRAVQTDVVEVGAAPNGVAVTANGVWVTNEVGGTLVHLDRALDERAVTALGGRPEGVALADGALWIAVQATGAAHRGGTLRMLAEPFAESIDPASNYTGWQLLSVVYDGLVGFKRVGGADGNTLVPDLASALPVPTDNRRRYTFRLRPGIRFSDGRELRASAVRYSFERLFRAKPANPDYYSGIVGGRTCMKHPQRCDLSRGIVTDDETGTVTIRLRAPDPEFLHKLALPLASVVPIGTAAFGKSPVIGTGPYRIEEYTPGRRLRLVRNRHFEEWSRAAQPEGVPDEIVLRLTSNRDAQVTAVQRGRADLVQGPLRDRLEEVRTRNASQVHVTPLPWTFSLWLNSTRPPFDDPLARRAVAYAVDRARLVESKGGSDLATSTCQLLPPNFPAYSRYCPYTLRSTEGGAWTAPDLEHARRLVAESGTEGMRVDVVGPGTDDLLAAMTTVLADTLRKLGYETSVRREPTTDAFFDTKNAGAARFEATVSGWGADYAVPWSYISGAVGCVEAPAYACAPAVERRLRETLRLQTRSPEAANAAWARLDRELVDGAILVPVITPKAIDFVSERVGNYQRHPILGLLISQLWLR